MKFLASIPLLLYEFLSLLSYVPHRFIPILYFCVCPQYFTSPLAVIFLELRPDGDAALICSSVILSALPSNMSELTAAEGGCRAECQVRTLKQTGSAHLK